MTMVVFNQIFFTRLALTDASGCVVACIQQLAEPRFRVLIRPCVLTETYMTDRSDGQPPAGLAD